jgi:hypothetical protein
VGLEWLYDPESYAGGSVVAGKASHASRLHPVKIINCREAFNGCSRMEKPNWRRKLQNRDQWRAIVKEASAHLGLQRPAITGAASAHIPTQSDHFCMLSSFMKSSTILKSYFDVALLFKGL